MKLDCIIVLRCVDFVQAVVQIATRTPCREIFRIAFSGASMTISVQLSVTGIYFGTPTSTNPKFTVTIPDNPTVKDVMDAAVAQVAAGGYPGASMFNYMAMGSYLQSISVNYTAPPKSSVAAGFYQLQQTTDSPLEEILQYYHYRPTTVNKNAALIQLNIDNAETPFTDPPTEPILSGDVIIWRRVTIQNAPTPQSFAYRAAVKNSNLMVAAMK